MRKLFVALAATAALSMAPYFGTTYRSTTPEVPTFDSLGAYIANQWTATELANIFGRYPGYWMYFGYKYQNPTSPIYDGFATLISATQARIPHPRFCMDHRADETDNYTGSTTQQVAGVSYALCDSGSPAGCSRWDSGVTTCQGGSNAGARCTVGDSTCTGGGTCGAADEIFDTDWIMRVPIAEHDANVTARWGGDDWMDAGTGHVWPSYLDKTVMQALATASDVPMAYGALIEDGGANDGKIEMRHFVLDLRIAAARTWKVKQVLAILAELGITGDEDFCLFSSYKPGWYNYHTTSDLSACSDSNDRTYAGYLWGATKPVGCDQSPDSNTYSYAMPIEDTQFGSGEYEAAMNAYYRELIAALDAEGLNGVKIMVERAPAGAGSIEDEVPSLTHSRRFLGEIDVQNMDPLP